MKLSAWSAHRPRLQTPAIVTKHIALRTWGALPFHRFVLLIAIAALAFVGMPLDATVVRKAFTL